MTTLYRAVNGHLWSRRNFELLGYKFCELVIKSGNAKSFMIKKQQKVAPYVSGIACMSTTIAKSSITIFYMEN